MTLTTINTMISNRAAARRLDELTHGLREERERALEEAGEQASVALGRAIAEIRAALGEDPGTANDDAPHDDEPETDDLFDESEKA